MYHIMWQLSYIYIYNVLIYIQCINIYTMYPCTFKLTMLLLIISKLNTNMYIYNVKFQIFIQVKRYAFTTHMLCIGECPSNSPFLKNNGAEAPKGPRPIVFKEWRDTRTFSNLKSTHCTLLISLIINLVTKKSLCIVSKVQSIKLFAPCGTLKVQREQ